MFSFPCILKLVSCSDDESAVLQLHHEIELGVVIGRQCKRVTEEEAMDYVGGYCLALDMTARDFQEEAKKKGHPWALAKVRSSKVERSLMDRGYCKRVPDEA